MNKLSPARLIVGLLIVLIGTALLLDNLGFALVGDLLAKLWPLAIILLGIVMLLNNKSNYLWAIIILAVGNILLLNTLDVLEVNAWRLVWPVVIIVVGVSIIVNRVATPGKDSDSHKVSKSDQDNVVAILSGSEQNNHSDDFKAGKITAVMGGVVYDLRKATIKKEATVEIFSLWGGVELIVPKSVQVQCSTLNILGGVENKAAKPDKKDAPVLRVIGDVIMAGVEIKN